MSKKPSTRILRVFSRLNVGGPSIHVILLAAELRGRGYETRLVVGREAPSEGNLLDLARQKDVDCVRLDALGREIRPLSDLVALYRLYRLIRRYRPAIVHTHTAKAGMIGRVAARLAGVPLVVHTYHGHVLRGYFGPVKTAVFRWLETLLNRSSNVVVAVSEAVGQDLLDLGVVRASQMRVIPLGLELRELGGSLPRGALRRESGAGPDAPVVGIVGRLVPIKDIGTFLKAAAAVGREVPEARFSVVGDGEERGRLEEQAAALGLGGTVHFHGWRRPIDAVYGDLDVVVNCSRNEGTPVALIEAMAAGRPVVATEVGGNAELLGAGARGLLVPPGNPEALAQAILEVVRSPESTRARACAAQQYVLARHSVEGLVDSVDSLYRELLAAQPGLA